MTFQMDNLKEMEVRLCRLEKQNRRIKAVGTAALVVVATLVVMGQAPSGKAIKADVVETKELRIVDDNSVMRGHFDVTGITLGNTKGDSAFLLPTTIAVTTEKGDRSTLTPEYVLVGKRGNIIWKAP